MSRMKELYDKVAQDCMLQEKFLKILKEAEDASKKTTEEKLTAFAKEAGYDVTVEEMQAFFKELAEKDRAELSAGELDMVAGGKHKGFVNFSIATIGIGCVYVSIGGAVDKKDCVEEYKELYTKE